MSCGGVRQKINLDMQSTFTQNIGLKGLRHMRNNFTNNPYEDNTNKRNDEDNVGVYGMVNG